jgi:hypothetical protein
MQTAYPHTDQSSGIGHEPNVIRPQKGHALLVVPNHAMYNTPVYKSHTDPPRPNSHLSRYRNPLLIIVWDVFDAVLRNNLDQHAFEIYR